jgi:hypothetical protein
MRNLAATIGLFVVGAVAALHPGVSPAEQRPAETPRPEAGEPRFEDWFADGALRVDVYHAGGLGAESWSLDAFVREPIWPGRRTALVDPTGYGQYRFRVLDSATGRELFSQGFASLMGEYVTTEESRVRRRTMHESVRFPVPRAAVRVAIDARDRHGVFREVYSVDLDPTDRAVRWERSYDFPVIDIEVNGPPAETVDVLVLGDGYTAEEMDKFRADVRRFAAAFFEHEPFGTSRARISLRAVEVLSRESGTDEPRKGIWRDTALGCSFNTFDSERYLTTEDDLAIREIGALAPYDTIYIMVNSSRYGGGGIFNAYSIFTADSEYAEYVFLHEFGHSFGALGDEYHDPGATSYDDDLFYPRGVEPWEPNLTALLDPRRVKWADLVLPGTPVPTPPDEAYQDRVGVFEGAGYRARGLYRPCFDSIMFHKGHLGYCPVSERAITRLVAWTAGQGWAP